MKDLLRNLFGIRKKRRSLPPSKRPGVDAILLRGNLKMRVTEEIPQDLWDWLLLSGWRYNPYRNDRRRYSALPNSALHQLVSARVPERDSLHRQLLDRAKKTPAS